jgi:hypothetical protein
VPKVERAHPLTFATPRTRVLSTDHETEKAFGAISRKDLNFDSDYFSMKRGNMSGSGKQKIRSGKQKVGLTGALRTTLLLAAIASEPPAATVDFSWYPFWYPSMFSEQLVGGGGGAEPLVGGGGAARAAAGAKGGYKRAAKEERKKKQLADASAARDALTMGPTLHYKRGPRALRLRHM